MLGVHVLVERGGWERWLSDDAVQRVPDEIMNDGNKWYSVAAGFFPGNKAPRLQNYFIYLSR